MGGRILRSLARPYERALLKKAGVGSSALRCVAAAAEEALGARGHCRCAQVDLQRGDGGVIEQLWESVMTKVAS